MHTSHAVGGNLTSLAALSRRQPGRFTRQEEEAAGIRTADIEIAKITVKPQDRNDFGDIADFAARLKLAGRVHSAILVRELGQGFYELIAGERRMRASRENEWLHIPAKIFPEDTPDYIVRMYQISENVDRKALTTRETAMGLARDIEMFGREDAARLWTNPNGKQRSESWISKHLRFQKYPPITRALFDAGLFEDIEAANKLADIEELDADVAEDFASMIRAGQKVGRPTLDARLQQLRAPLTAVAGATVGAAGELQNPGNAAMQAVAGHDGAAAGGSTETSDANAAPSSTQAPSAAPSADRSASPDGSAASANAAGQAPANVSPRTPVSAEAKLEARREALYRGYTGSIQTLRHFRDELEKANPGAEAMDWQLYVAFAGTVCATLVGVGVERAQAMMQHLVDEMVDKSPAQILAALHPTTRTGVLPDDFGYDTGREIHPARPEEWAL